MLSACRAKCVGANCWKQIRTQLVKYVRKRMVWGGGSARPEPWKAFRKKQIHYRVSDLNVFCSETSRKSEPRNRESNMILFCRSLFNSHSEASLTCTVFWKPLPVSAVVLTLTIIRSSASISCRTWPGLGSVCFLHQEQTSEERCVITAEERKVCLMQSDAESLGSWKLFEGE